MSAIMDRMPEPAREYVADHPRILYALTVPLVIFTAWNLLRAIRLHEQLSAVIAERASDAARAASEALGG